MVTALIILGVGIFIFCACQRYNQKGGRGRYQKVVNVDSTDDERVVIKS